ncbi:MAG: conjugal transfer protein TraO [Bacteroidaceae bacterium]|nr:conjugal transfer protein TraO [Bacteroidaceae bacterium]
MKKLLMIGVLALTMGQASAQRCLPKMQGIELSGSFVDGKPLDAAFCGSVSLSTYTKNGSKWVFGGEYLQRDYGYADTTIPVAQFTAEGGYYKKLFTDGSKTMFVYGGASVLAGYESVNWGETLLDDGARLTDKDSFLYGGALTLNIEVYLSDRLALTGNVRERCLWGNDTGHFHTQYGIGFKLIIN